MTRSAFRHVAPMILLVALVAACGGAPATGGGGAASGTTPDQAAGGASPTAEGAAEVVADGCGDRLQQIYDEVDGLDWEQRRQRLIELAAEEDGPLMVYSSSSQAVAEALIEEFTRLTDLKAELYRANIPQVMQRVTTERASGGVRADVLLANDPEMTILAREGYFLPLQTPAAEQIAEDYVREDRIAFAILYYTAAWNTDAVAPEQAPTTWQEALTYDGLVLMEANSWDWFATMVHYFMDEEGMSEDEAVQLFRDAADVALVGAGKTATLQILQSGGADVAPSLFMHSVHEAGVEGAPVEWQPPVQPLPGRSNDVAILEDCERPAKGLLFADAVLREGQPAVGALNYPPATTEPVDTFQVPLADYETISMDIDLLIDEREKWESLYLDIVGGAESVEAPEGGGGG